MILSATALTALALIACSDGESPSDAGNDSGVDAHHLDGSTRLCPAFLPADGSACTALSVICEYGPSPTAPVDILPDTNCNSIATCTPNGVNGGATWAVRAPTDMCQPTSAATCPATPDAIANAYCGGNSDCGGVGAGKDCFYPDMPLCGCGTYCGPSTHAWVCAKPALGCPPLRPVIGSVCNIDSLRRDQDAALKCAYGETCDDQSAVEVASGGVTLVCTSKWGTAPWTVWQPTSLYPCP